MNRQSSAAIRAPGAGCRCRTRSLAGFGWLVVWLAWLAGLAAAGAANLAFIHGTTYVPITQWAEANGFSARMIELGHGVVLSDAGTRLVFEVDSAQAEINGIHARLSFPIASQRDELFISELDLNTLVHPLVDPPRFAVRRNLTICLDPGHGGRDSGNRVRSGWSTREEKTYTLQLALALRRDLTARGFRVVLTRSRDVYVPLPARPAVANDCGADLFVSLHFNASQADPASVAGPETYCITPAGARSSNDHGESLEFGASMGAGPTPANRNGNESKSLLLAYEMEKALVQNLHAPDRSVRRARFAVLRDARMPAILIEGGYMTNPGEGRKIDTAAYRQQMADAITRGILNYLRFATPTGLARAAANKS